MKSLSSLLLIGTITAITLGSIFVATPVFAENQTPSIDQNNSPEQPEAPVTGNSAESALAETNQQALAFEQDSPAVATFSFSLEKDTASAEAAQEAEAQAAERVAGFVATVTNGNANQITGLYVDNVLAYTVTGQNGNAAYVTQAENEVTKFAMAAEYGTQAFLAHNYLAGAAFFKLTEGQTVTLVYGDGSSQDFRIEAAHRYQALSPNSTQSNFVDLATGEQLSTPDLFYSIYNSDHAVVLQTCIENEGISTWGRLFVIAVPLS